MTRRDAELHAKLAAIDTKLAAMHELIEVRLPAPTAWATVAEAATRLDVAEVTIRRMIRDGRMRSKRVGAVGVRVDLASVRDDPRGSLAVISPTHPAGGDSGGSRRVISRVRASAGSSPSVPPYSIEADPASEWSGALANPGMRSADAMREELWAHLRAVEAERGGERPTLIRLSLTMPEWSDADALARHARAFADLVAADGDGAAAWIVLDVSPADRAHLYGVVLTRRPVEWMRSEWCALSGAAAPAVKVQTVAGQAGPWSDENTKLRASLARVVPYALKDLPSSAGAPPDLDARAVTSGPLVEVWARAIRRGGGSR